MISLTNNFPELRLPIDYLKYIEYRIVVLNHDCSLIFKTLLNKLMPEEDDDFDNVSNAVFGKFI